MRRARDPGGEGEEGGKKDLPRAQDWLGRDPSEKVIHTHTHFPPHKFQSTQMRVILRKFLFRPSVSG